MELEKVYFTQGVARELPEVGYSEVTGAMGIAGRTDMYAQVVGKFGNMIQLYDSSGAFSFPISCGEAGLYRDNDSSVYGYKRR